MKKLMKKTIMAFCVALSFFMCNSTFVFAAVCDGAPDGVHHFDAHVREFQTFTEDGGTHTCLYGYDSQNKPIYRDCEITYTYQYCNCLCIYCGTVLDGDRHYHLRSTSHSINHN